MRAVLACLLLGGCATTFNGVPVGRITALTAVGIVAVAVATKRDDDDGKRHIPERDCPTCAPKPETPK